MVNKKSPILVTGAAGFIGYALVKELLLRGENVIGIDKTKRFIAAFDLVKTIDMTIDNKTIKLKIFL